MRRRKHQRGSVMLEFALVTPVLFLLCFGAMDLSRVYRSAMISAAAARAGVQYASSGSAAEDTAGIIQAAKTDAGNTAGMTVSVDRYCACSIGGDPTSCTTTCSDKSKYVKVTARMPFKTMWSVPGMSSAFDLKSVSHVRVQ